MTDHKFTDEEIVRALECCTNIDVDSCNKCPIYPFSLNMTQEECMETAMSNALDLLYRQKAKIKRLQSTLERAIYNGVKADIKWSINTFVKEMTEEQTNESQST